MNNKFTLSKTLYVILFYVFVFGIVLEFTRSEFVLRFNPENRETARVTSIPLPKTLKATLKQDTYLVVNSPNNPDSMKLNNNIIQTLTYMHKESVEAPLNALPTDLKNYTGVIITFEEIDQMRHLNELITYVEEGGSVFFAIRPGINDALYSMYRKLGIYEVGSYTTATGIELLSNILIMKKGMRIDEDFLQNSSLMVGLGPTSRLHVKSINNIPLLWDVPFKRGKFVVFNGTFLSTKDNRGLITGSISLMKDDYIYPIMNMKIANIDDFPAPVPKGYHSLIRKNHDMDTESFYRNIWWPFIQEGAKRYDLKYAGYAIQTYNNRIQAPFSDETGEQQDQLIKYGRELLKMGGEIGIHGYNHQPLTIDQVKVTAIGYRAWNSQSDMEEALKELNNYLETTIPNRKAISYVPPSNIIDESGLAAISVAFPTIKVISSIYLEDATNQAYVQEFTNDGRYINLPRISSGYGYSPETQWSIANAINSIGVFSHFIHPDDILDEERTSSKSWGQLSSEYNSMLSSIKDDFPWLRSLLPSEAAEWFERYSRTTIYTEENAQGIRVYCDNFAGEISFLFKTNKKIDKVKDCTAEEIDDGVYLIKGYKEIFEIGLVE
jgi:hypothetical protein